MANLISWLGKKVDDIVPGDQSFLHRPSAPARPSAPVVNTINRAIGGSPVQQVNQFRPTSAPYKSPLTIVPGLQTATNLANDTLVKPYVNIGKELGGLGYNVATNTNYAKTTPFPQFAGDVATGALNVLGGAGSLGRLGARAAAPIVSKLGPGVGTKAVGNLVKTTVATAPITAGYGAASTLSSGDTNPIDIIKNTALGAATAPALGLLHGAVPIARATPGAVKAAYEADPIIGRGEQTGMFGKQSPKVQALNDKARQLNQQRQNLLSSGKSETHPSVRANERAYQSVIQQRNRVIGQGGSVPLGTKPKVSPKQPTIEQVMSDAVTRTKEQYAKPTIRSKVAEANNPYNTGVKIDKAYAKSIGVPLRDIPKTESTEALAEKSANSIKIANNHLASDESAIGQSIKKYGENTPQSREFNFYRVAMRDLEHRSLQGKPIHNVDTAKLMDFVKNYEANNPNARSEIMAINKEVNALQDRAVSLGHLDPEQVAAARAKSPNFYTPIQRATADNVERASMNASSRGSIGKQSLLQDFTGSSIPVDNTFNALTDYVQNAYKEFGRVELAQKYAERVKQGLAPGRYTDTVENVQQRKALGQQIQQIRDTIAQATKDRNKTNTNARLANKDLSAAQKTASTAKINKGKVVTQIKAVIKDITPEGDASSALSALSDKDHIQLFNALVDDNTRGIEAIRKKLVATTKSNAKGSEALASKQEHSAAIKASLQDMRNVIKGLNAVKSDTRKSYAEFTADPTTGLQVVSGRADGVTYKIETTPEVARFLQGLGEEKINSGLKLARAAQEPFRSVFTGVLNPPFAAASATWNMVMAPVVSAQGIRVYGPKAVYESLKSFNKSSKFQKILSQNGAQKFTGNLATSADISTPEAIATTRNLATKAEFSLKHPIKSFHNLDVLQAKAENAQRTGIAKAAHDARLRKGGTPEQAIADAVYAYNNVLPNFGRYSSAVRQADAVLMYAGASQAGTRAMLTAFSRDKVGTSAKLGVVTAGLASITAYNMSNDKAQEFYKDMVDSKKQYLLDNNLILIAPGASKDRKTGQWNGITKISIAPELRPINHAVWSKLQSDATGSNVSSTNYATSMFDFLTGQARTLTNPIVQTGVALASNKNPLTGKEIVPGDYKDLPNDQQKFGSTSKAAIDIAKATGQSPLKVDYVIRGLGLPGAAVAGIGSDKGVGGSVVDAIANKYVGAYGKSDGAKYFDNFNKVSEGIKSIDDKKTFQALHAKDPIPGMMDSAEKAQIFLNRPEVLNAERELNKRQISTGKPGNPIFDLSNDQLQKVLVYRSAKMLNAGKQTYDKNGNPLFTSLGLDEPWYQNLRNNETGFYQAIAKATGKDPNSGAPATFSGATKVEASPEIQKKLDQYYTLAKGTGARSNFLRANPDILDYWQSSDGFTNKERSAIGLKPLEDPSGPGGKYAQRPRKPSFKAVGFKTAKTSKIAMPKGVKVRKLAYKPAKTRKIAVSKMPKIA